jgi:hypothetical protein
MDKIHPVNLETSCKSCLNSVKALEDVARL